MYCHMYSPHFMGELCWTRSEIMNDSITNHFILMKMCWPGWQLLWLAGKDKIKTRMDETTRIFRGL